MHYTELASRRRALGLSRAQLAQRLNRHPNTIAQWEHGDRPIGQPDALRLALQALEDEQLTSNLARRAMRVGLAEPGESAHVPMVADVLRLMLAEHIGQDEAVRRLGGTP